MNPKVDRYIERQYRWIQEVMKLREIALNSGLQEEFKWGNPCYMAHDGNIVLIHTFKNYCAYLFFKGALINDPDSLLVQQTENVQAARQIRFTDLHQIIALEARLSAIIRQAIEIEKAGLKVELKETEAFSVPAEFEQRLDEVPALKEAFEKLTPGRQRGYLLFFGQAKQSSTRVSRIDKYIEKILEGKGLND